MNTPKPKPNHRSAPQWADALPDPSPRRLQAARLCNRFGMPRARAELLAEHAFGECRS